MKLDTLVKSLQMKLDTDKIITKKLDTLINSVQTKLDALIESLQMVLDTLIKSYKWY